MCDRQREAARLDSSSSSRTSSSVAAECQSPPMPVVVTTEGPRKLLYFCFCCWHVTFSKSPQEPALVELALRGTALDVSVFEGITPPDCKNGHASTPTVLLGVGAVLISEHPVGTRTSPSSPASGRVARARENYLLHRPLLVPALSKGGTQPRWMTLSADELQTLRSSAARLAMVIPPGPTSPESSSATAGGGSWSEDPQPLVSLASPSIGLVNCGIPHLVEL